MSETTARPASADNIVKATRWTKFKRAAKRLALYSAILFAALYTILFVGRLLDYLRITSTSYYPSGFAPPDPIGPAWQAVSYVLVSWLLSLLLSHLFPFLRKLSDPSWREEPITPVAPFE